MFSQSRMVPSTLSLLSLLCILCWKVTAAFPLAAWPGAAWWLMLAGQVSWSPGLLVSVSCSPHSVPASVLTRRCRHSVCRYFSFQIKCIIIWSEFRRRSWSCASSCTPWCSAEASTLLSTGSSAITSSLSNKDGLLFSFLFDLGRLKHLPIVGFKRFVFINHLGIRYIFLFST